MRPNRKQLSPQQSERVASLWQAVSGLRPSISVSLSKQVSAMVFVTVTFPRGSNGFNGRVRLRYGWLDAPRVAGELFVRSVLMSASPRLSAPQRDRLLGIVCRFIERGSVTPAALRDVALMTSINGLTIFLAQFA